MPSISDRLAKTGKHFYCICFSIRSGSSLLCEDLAQWGVGEPTEYFQLPNPNLDGVNMADYLVSLVETMPGDWFGFKTAWDQVFDLTERLNADGEQSVRCDLATVFPNLTYVHIVRRDKLGQAISAWRATKSGSWHWPTGTEVDRGYPAYDFEAIKAHLQKSLADDWLWQRHFEGTGMRQYTLTYEDYLSDRAWHLQRIVEHLGASASQVPLEDRLQVMRDDWTERIAARFVQDLYTVPDPLLVRTVLMLPLGTGRHAVVRPRDIWTVAGVLTAGLAGTSVSLARARSRDRRQRSSAPSVR